MFNRVLPNQIPLVWDVIKFVIPKVFPIEQKDLPDVYNKTLAELMSDKAQCFIKRNDETKKIEAMEITAINIDKFSGVKTWELKCLYAFSYNDFEAWKEFFNYGLEYAKAQGCQYVTTESSNKRVWEILEMLGFKEISRNFTYKIGGE